MSLRLNLDYCCDAFGDTTAKNRTLYYLSVAPQLFLQSLIVHTFFSGGFCGRLDI